jgi:hypothetical protein
MKTESAPAPPEWVDALGLSLCLLVGCGTLVGILQVFLPKVYGEFIFFSFAPVPHENQWSLGRIFYSQLKKPVVLGFLCSSCLFGWVALLWRRARLLQRPIWRLTIALFAPPLLWIGCGQVGFFDFTSSVLVTCLMLISVRPLFRKQWSKQYSAGLLIMLGLCLVADSTITTAEEKDLAVNLATIYCGHTASDLFDALNTWAPLLAASAGLVAWAGVAAISLRIRVLAIASATLLYALSYTIRMDALPAGLGMSLADLPGLSQDTQSSRGLWSIDKNEAHRQSISHSEIESPHNPEPILIKNNSREILSFDLQTRQALEDARHQLDESHILQGPILRHLLEIALRDFDTQAYVEELLREVARGTKMCAPVISKSLLARAIQVAPSTPQMKSLVHYMLDPQHFVQPSTAILWSALGNFAWRAGNQSLTTRLRGEVRQACEEEKNRKACTCRYIRGRGPSHRLLLPEGCRHQTRWLDASAAALGNLRGTVRVNAFPKSGVRLGLFSNPVVRSPGSVLDASAFAWDSANVARIVAYTSTSDQGRFEFTDLIQGNYRVMLWEKDLGAHEQDSHTCPVDIHVKSQIDRSIEIDFVTTPDKNCP